MTVPIEKNRDWIAGLHQGIDGLGEDLKAVVMKPAGTRCASALLSLCEEHLGKSVDTLEDLINGWNSLRVNRGLTGSWEFQRGTIRAVFHECGCPLVRSGLIKLHPVQCLCSEGMMEAIFSKVANKPVEVVVKHSIGRGDDVCEFAVGTPSVSR